MRRLDAALSNDPLNPNDQLDSRQSPATKEISRKVREVRKVFLAAMNAKIAKPTLKLREHPPRLRGSA